jgi:hypothetical protein
LLSHNLLLYLVLDSSNLFLMLLHEHISETSSVASTIINLSFGSCEVIKLHVYVSHEIIYHETPKDLM